MHLIVTGTDTGVGKTHFTAWLLRRWRELGRDAVAIKPWSCGGAEDAEQLGDAMGWALPLDEIAPQRFFLAASPWQAAEAEGRTADLDRAGEDVRFVCSRFSWVLIEGAGGWRTPLSAGTSFGAWAAGLQKAVIVVARPGLGTLNHTVLTVESIVAAGAMCMGIVLNRGLGATDDPTIAWNASALRAITGLPLFEYAGGAQSSGKIPGWLGGEQG
jgi:dethiobiotin synthetase